jgi:hypothetical protein
MIEVDSDDEGSHDDKLPVMATSELIVLAEKIEAGHIS